MKRKVLELLIYGEKALKNHKHGENFTENIFKIFMAF